MISLLVTWLISSAAVWVTAVLLPGFKVRGFAGALLVAAILGVLQVLIGWLLFNVIGILTLGIGYWLAFLTRWLVTALLLIVTDKVSRSLTIKDFKTAFVGAIIISLITTLAQRLV